MSKPIVKPLTFTGVHAYMMYAENLIKENEGYKLKTDPIQRNKEKKQVVDKDGKTVLTYSLFRSVVDGFNRKAGDKLLLGYSIDLLNGLGYLFVINQERDPAKPRINRAESFNLRRKLKAAGTLTETNWLVYHTDEAYCRIKWYKIGNKMTRSGKMEDLPVYTFASSKGEKGYKRKFGRVLKAQPNLRGLYPFLNYVNNGVPDSIN